MWVIAPPLPWPEDSLRSFVDTLALDLPDPRPLADRLDLLGGVWLPTYGTDASIRTVSLEGGRSRGTLLAVHGIPLPSLFGEGADLSLMPPSWVQGVSLLRGGASGWYGSGAFQGVLNLDLRPGPGTGAGWSEHTLWMQAAPGPWAVFGQLWPAMDPPGTWLARYARPGHWVEGMWVERSFEPPAPTGFPGWRRQRERWGWGVVRATVHRVHMEGLVTGMDRSYSDRTLGLASRHRSLRLQLRLFRPLFTGWGKLSLSYQPLQSSDMGHHTLSELQVGWVHTRDTPFPLRAGIHLELYRQDRRWTALPSVRMTARWNIPGVQLFPEAFVSWNPPTPGDLFWSGDAFARGNPRLRPEGLLGGALTVRLTTWPLQARLYAKRARDLIVWAPNAHGQWQPDNQTRASLYGAELRWTTHSFQISWSVLRNRDGEGHPLLYRPERLGSVFLTSPNRWRIRPWLHLRYTGSRVRSALVWDRLPPRLDLALGLVWSLPQGHLALSVDHLLDSLWIPGYADNRVGDLDGYAPPTRTFRVEWRASP
ncbi:MAG: TonB-dependent receptor plug domain-containing protein [Candidatus Hydrothermae bacterium]|nr:TonB-dependent receptor plug domain-containing protein [Candidatus Hydrothermae bacterium]